MTLTRTDPAGHSEFQNLDRLDWLRIWATLPAKSIPPPLARDLQRSIARLCVQATTLASVGCVLAVVSTVILFLPWDRPAATYWVGAHSVQFLLLGLAIAYLQYRLKHDRLTASDVNWSLVVPVALNGLLWGTLPYLVGTEDIGFFYLTTCIAVVVCTTAFWWTPGHWPLFALFSAILLGSIAVSYVMLDSEGGPLGLAGAPIMFALLVGISFLASCGLAASRLHLVMARSGEELVTLLLDDYRRYGNDWLWEADANLCLIEAPSRMVEAAYGDSNFTSNGSLTAILAGSPQAAQALAKQQPFEALIETRGAKGAGTIRLLGRPVLVSGRFLGYRGVGTDDLAARRANETERANERLDAMIALTSGLAHDFNNQLATVMGSIELAALQPGLTDNTKKQLRNALGSCIRTRRTTADLVVAAGLDASYKATVFDAREATELVIAEVKLLYPTVRFHTVFSNPALIDADQSLYARAARNLIENACQAVNDQADEGVVEVNLRANPDDLQAPSTVDRSDQVVCLDVIDNGPGVSPAVATNLFEPFVSTKKEAGTGLGLSIVRGFANQANGTIRVVGRTRGTHFQLVLPLARSGPSNPEPVRPKRPASALIEEADPDRGSDLVLAGRRILLVEDDPHVAANLEARLKSLGADVETTHSVVDTLDRFGTETLLIDHLITDLRLPDGEGYAVVQGLRQTNPYLPVLYISGFTSTLPSTVAPFLRGPFLPKPFSTPELLEALEASDFHRQRGDSTRDVTASGQG